MIVRSYRDDDFVGVDRLWRRVFPDDPPHNRAEAAIPAKLALADDLLIVAADDDGTVIGTALAGYDGHRGWLYAVAVDPEQQGKGMGRTLVEEACRRLAAQGCGKVNLQVREGNKRVAAFYRELGFSEEPRISMGRTLA